MDACRLFAVHFFVAGVRGDGRSPGGRVIVPRDQPNKKQTNKQKKKKKEKRNEIK